MQITTPVSKLPLPNWGVAWPQMRQTCTRLISQTSIPNIPMDVPKQRVVKAYIEFNISYTERIYTRVLSTLWRLTWFYTWMKCTHWHSSEWLVFLYISIIHRLDSITDSQIISHQDAVSITNIAQPHDHCTGIYPVFITQVHKLLLLSSNSSLWYMVILQCCILYVYRYINEIIN